MENSALSDLIIISLFFINVFITITLISYFFRSFELTNKKRKRTRLVIMSILIFLYLFLMPLNTKLHDFILKLYQ